MIIWRSSHAKTISPDLPLCGRPDLKNISTHLLQVHSLSSEERKPYLRQAQGRLGKPRVSLGLRIPKRQKKSVQAKVNIRHPQGNPD